MWKPRVYEIGPHHYILKCASHLICDMIQDYSSSRQNNDRFRPKQSGQPVFHGAIPCKDKKGQNAPCFTPRSHEAAQCATSRIVQLSKLQQKKMLLVANIVPSSKARSP